MNFTFIEINRNFTSFLTDILRVAFRGSIWTILNFLLPFRFENAVGIMIMNSMSFVYVIEPAIARVVRVSLE